MLEISEEKAKRIYEVALKEFANKDYNNASTNVIAKESNISKGSLFNYYGNKLNLFFFVAEKAMEKYEKVMMLMLEDLSDDMFERVYETQMIKMKLAYELPDETKIITRLVLSDEPEIKAKIGEYYNYYEKIAYSKLPKDIDYSKFKEGINPELVYNTLLYISYGFIETLQRKYKNKQEKFMEDIDEISRELWESINLLKMSVYK